MKLDLLVARSERLSKICKNALHRIFKIRLSEEILLCVIATAAAGFLSADTVSQSSASFYMYLLSLVIMCAVWAMCALVCGFRRQWGFGAFAAAFWLLPQLFIYRADNVMTMAEYDKAVDIIGRISHLFVTESISAFAASERAALIAAVVILVAAEVLMVLGMLAREKIRSSDFYCDFRADNPQYS